VPLRWNIDHQPLVIHPQLPAIQPGQSYDFSDEQVANGIGGLFSEEPPFAKEERAIKKARKAIKRTEPAEPEKE
jgi:hypothetical protein